MFAVVLVGVKSSEYMNTFLRNRWHTFSRQNYFDENGLFMGVMWSGPLLILGFSMLVSQTVRNLNAELIGNTPYLHDMITVMGCRPH